MDELDRRILQEVDGGTIRSTQLARRLNVPLSTVHFRLRRLETNSVIERYKGEVDWRKAGFTISAFILVTTDANLLKSLGKSQDKLLQELLGLHYVREGHIIAGEADILLKVIARDPAHLKELLLTHIDAKAGVVRTRTLIALE
jgi:DNA-binding Lrp family transcriptional regulator